MGKGARERDGGRGWMRAEDRRTTDERLNCVGYETMMYERSRKAHAGKNVIEDDYSLDSMG